MDRTKHTIEVVFHSSDDRTIAADRPIDVRVNVQEPDVFDYGDETTSGGSLSPTLALLDPDDPELLSQTIAEENLTEEDFSFGFVDYDFDDLLARAMSPFPGGEVP